MTSKKEYEAFLDDNELLAVQMFADNELQLEAIRKVFLFRLYSVGALEKGEPSNTKDNYAFEFIAHFPNASNEEVANNLRAKWEAWRIMLNAFDDLKTFKKKEKGSETIENPAV